MKRILYFIGIFATCIGVASAAVRDENATNRANDANQQNQNTISRTATTRAVAGRSAVVRTAAPTVSRTANNTSPQDTSRTTTSRTSVQPSANARADTIISRSATTTVQRTPQQPASLRVSRAATVAPPRAATLDTVAESMSSTRVGAEYEQCKSAYFNCMDQFCQLKNDDYRRCSCSNRVFDLTEIRETMQDAGSQLTVFNENLDVVGMTAAQATAMKTASEGENALTADTSASKQLLQAIMNSIRGTDASVGGKYSDLNSITLSFDTVNAFGTADAGQVIASYNGRNLYDAVYPQCREAVRADCTDAQLQRAINAYLMAVEQDCNTVESALKQQQREMKSAVRESSAMLDLARVENRQEHNSDDMASCLANVEAAILSEEVCGSGYHKCLDNGEFIDVSTGAPIAGVVDFYKLGNLLKFADGVDAADQKLSKVLANKTFVNNFVNRVKKFAEPALDKCTEIADTVWAEYLDKAMLDIYYAQQSKVSTIKQGCFDLVSTCYMNTNTQLTAAMKELISDDTILLQPDKVTLTNEMCRDYIDSCNMMFYEQTDGQNIVTDYINHRQDTDTLTACRAVVKQCFDEYGGTGYENFYYPYSGLFKTGLALDWFTLYEYTGNDNSNPTQDKDNPVSKCAQQLKTITSCNTPEMMEAAFGGFDKINASLGKYSNEQMFYYDVNGEYNEKGGLGKHPKYGTLRDTPVTVEHGLGIHCSDNQCSIKEEFETIYNARILAHHTPRPTGVATEIYNQIVDSLTTQCMNVQGRFLELQFIKNGLYAETNQCISNFSGSMEYGGGEGLNPNLVELYGISKGEDMCPRDYDITVDTQSWGACLCWENGGRRSKNGKSPKCIGGFPVTPSGANDRECTSTETFTPSTSADDTDWCLKEPTYLNQICPPGIDAGPSGLCQSLINGKVTDYENLPDGLL